VRGLFARFGVTNIWNERYANHLNAQKPFTGAGVPEPGRAAYLNMSVAF
jgi:outer membrane receptor protein involved in Fe transport